MSPEIQQKEIADISVANNESANLDETKTSLSTVEGQVNDLKAELTEHEQRELREEADDITEEIGELTQEIEALSDTGGISSARADLIARLSPTLTLNSKLDSFEIDGNKGMLKAKVSTVMDEKYGDLEGGFVKEALDSLDPAIDLNTLPRGMKRKFMDGVNREKGLMDQLAKARIDGANNTDEINEVIEYIDKADINFTEGTLSTSELGDSILTQPLVKARSLAAKSVASEENKSAVQTILDDENTLPANRGMAESLLASIERDQAFMMDTFDGGAYNEQIYSGYVTEINSSISENNFYSYRIIHLANQLEALDINALPAPRDGMEITQYVSDMFPDENLENQAPAATAAALESRVLEAQTRAQRSIDLQYGRYSDNMVELMAREEQSGLDIANPIQRFYMIQDVQRRAFASETIMAADQDVDGILGPDTFDHYLSYRPSRQATGNNDEQLMVNAMREGITQNFDGTYRYVGNLQVGEIFDRITGDTSYANGVIQNLDGTWRLPTDVQENAILIEEDENTHGIQYRNGAIRKLDGSWTVTSEVSSHLGLGDGETINERIDSDGNITYANGMIANIGGQWTLSNETTDAGGHLEIRAGEPGNYVTPTVVYDDGHSVRLNGSERNPAVANIVTYDEIDSILNNPYTPTGTLEALFERYVNIANSSSVYGALRERSMQFVSHPNATIEIKALVFDAFTEDGIGHRMVRREILNTISPSDLSAFFHPLYPSKNEFERIEGDLAHIFLDENGVTPEFCNHILDTMHNVYSMSVGLNRARYARWVNYMVANDMRLSGENWRFLKSHLNSDGLTTLNPSLP